MENPNNKPAPIAKFAGCTGWSDESATWLAEASFLTIEAHGEVWPSAAEAHYANVEVNCGAEWCIIANFAHNPGWVAASFDLIDRDLAFAAVLIARRSRPVFYITPTETFEISGDTVTELLSCIRARDPGIDSIVFEKNHPWLFGDRTMQ